jgi:hypothetical protein
MFSKIIFQFSNQDPVPTLLKTRNNLLVQKRFKKLKGFHILKNQIFPKQRLAESLFSTKKTALYGPSETTRNIESILTVTRCP